ncbi:Transcription initiation factor IIF [Abeliophyllum distichum]|uniref:Transcription initiation factor IIF n=1 Tax=Abeliophyllum distichum TaxID=126358 RepID=A0ABD1TJ49_9LAMI
MAEKPNSDNAAAEAAKITNICQLDASKAERHVWLMKCPPVVSRAMQNNHLPQPPPPPFSADGAKDPFSNSGPTVSKVIVSVDPLLPNNDFSSTQFTMELAGNAYGNIPKCYSMDMSTDFVPMSVFSESSQVEKLSVEGKIYHKFDMKPHNENIEDYAKLCRERTNKYMTKTRHTKFIDDNSGMHMRMRPMPGTVDSKPSGPTDKKKMPAKGSEMKRTRRDPEEMEKIVFKLFERQPNWTLKQLILETDQPEQFLKNMLKLLCVYNNKGTNQGTYELKPEYKRSEDK